MARSTVKPLLAALGLVLLGLAFSSPATAFVYWANGGGTFGRASLEGTEVNQSFVADAGTPCGAAVDDAHVYWANDSDPGTIERANLDGTGRQSLIEGATFPCGVAVDASHVYWANVVGTIGRADLNGANPSQEFIGTGGLLCGLAVDKEHVYWADSDGAIGQANIDGSAVNESFITGASRPCGVAVDSAHLYWANGSVIGSIGRADLNGTGVDQSFITGATFPCGVAVDAGHVYWANDTAIGSIARANLDGTGADQGFIPGASFPCGVAVDALPSSPPAPGPNPPPSSPPEPGSNPPPSSPPEPESTRPPSNEFAFGRPKLNVRKGTARLPVTVPGPGELALSGGGVMASRAAAVSSAPGTVVLSIRAKGQKRRTLRRTGKVDVRLAVSYTPTGGSARTQSTALKLRQR